MSAPHLTWTSLGTVGLEYIKTRLDRNKPLRQALAERLFEQGEVWTWAPVGTNFDLVDLRDGGLPAGVTQESHWDLMTGFVVEYLAQNGRLAIIEDHDSTPDDPWLTNDPDRPALPPGSAFATTSTGTRVNRTQY
jgi:hypothetical protein